MMYPLDVLNLFPPFPRNDKVFVAMSFDKKSENRWENVIRPAVIEIGLEPYRVDMKKISDSITTDIVTGISNCRLFFADVSAFDKLNDRPIRNENVLYEVGIAHSRRLSQEVILFRSDNYNLMFDLANIRVNSYDPDGDIKGAKDFVIESLNSALNEINLQKHLSVKIAVDSLNSDSVNYIMYLVFFDTNRDTYLRFFDLRDSNPAIRANTFSHLIDLGIMCLEYPILTNGIMEPSYQKHKYTLTPFGKVVAEVVAAKFGLKCDFVKQQVYDNEHTT